MTKNQLSENISNILEFFKNFHNKNPYRKGMLKEEIANFLKIDIKFLDTFLIYLNKDKKIKCQNNLWSYNNFYIKLKENEIILSKQIVEMIDRLDFNTLSINELIDRIDEKSSLVKKIVDIEISNNNLILIDGKLLFSYLKIQSLIENIKKYFSKNSSLDVKTFKNLITTTRKFAVPLLEYLDKLNITYRIGNERKQCKYS